MTAPPATLGTRPRAEVPAGDTWDLTQLFATDAAWEAAFGAWEARVGEYAHFKGTLANGAAALRAALEFDTAFDRAGDALGTYAFLKTTEDVADSKAQAMKGRYIGVAARAAEGASFLRPELLALDPALFAGYLADAQLAPYKLALERLERYRPHTLSAAEERLLALQSESAQTAHQVFDQLTDADLTFGKIELSPGQTIDLTHGSYVLCLESEDRAVRKQAFHQYYESFSAHANTLAACLAGSVKQDIFTARARNYPSARAAALFPDLVPESVYDNLVHAVRKNLPAVHRYYALRRKVMKLPDLHFYDVYLPMVRGVRKEATWDEGVELVLDALKPLGGGYNSELARGLRGRWCDRYENKGKHSGAFSSGCYDSEPYILMNYQPGVFDHVYTLAHEAGHSMHTLLSKQQPYQYSQYTIFVAEVASTFNEQLLGRHLMRQASSDLERAYFLNRELDDIRRTIVRQTMFAEFESITHRLAEANEPLTLERLRGEYQQLLDAYFGPDFALDPELSLECLRIPHFYRAFYVYKYATGLSAAIALADRVQGGGERELGEYLHFLKSGSSRDPLELLRGAGVDLTTPEPIDRALERFGRLVDELEVLVG